MFQYFQIINTVSKNFCNSTEMLRFAYCWSATNNGEVCDNLLYCT